VSIGWDVGSPDQEAAITLEPGVVIRAGIRGLRAGDTVRLYYLRDPSGASWPPDSAPLLDEARIRDDGECVLRGMGLGIYQLRAPGDLMEVPLGTVEAKSLGEIPCSGAFHPATLEVHLASKPSGSGDVPVLSPMLQGGGWSSAPQPSKTTYAGTQSGATLTFEGVAPGDYLLRLPPGQWDVNGAQVPGVRVDLGPGVVRSVEWKEPDPTATFRVRIVLPPGVANGAALYAVLPRSAAPTFAMNLAWRSLGKDGSLMGQGVRGTAGIVVIGTPVSDNALNAGTLVVAPIGIIPFSDPGEVDGATVTLQELCSLTVTTKDGSPALVDIHCEEWSGAFVDRFIVQSGMESKDLLPGRYTIAATEVGVPSSSPRKGEVDLILAPGEGREVRIVLK
jgi:hypothetical protein